MRVHIAATSLILDKTAVPLRTRREADVFGTLTWVVIGVGVFLRLFHFFYNRSLFIDESFLANSLIRMGFLELAAGPLEYEQKAPIGYLFMAKLAVVLFGKGEMALRLFSLVCGIGALFLFRTVARHFLEPVGVFIAVTILAITPPSVVYAVEAKQYCTEMLATVAALYLYLRFHRNPSPAAGLAWGVAGAVLVWFSYSVIFVLAGMAIVVSLYHLFRKDWAAFFRSVIPFSLWLVSFAVNYLLFTHKHAGSEWLVDWFNFYKAFMPFPPASVKDLAWFAVKPLHVLHFTLGLSWLDLSFRYSEAVRGIARMPVLPLLCWIAGAVWFFRRDRKLFWVFTAPFLLALLASGIRMYPLHERLNYFLLPVIILLVTRGFVDLLNRLPARGWRYALTALLLVGAAGNSAYALAVPSQFGRPWKNATAQDALLYVNDRYQPGDVVYVYWNFKHFYRYYKEAYNLRYDATLGSDVRFVSRDTTEYTRNILPDVEALTGKKRVWVIYNKYQREALGDPFGKPAWYYNHPKPGQVFYDLVAAQGRAEEVFETREMKVTRFDLSGH